jgi:hypothetical protein
MSILIVAAAREVLEESKCERQRDCSTRGQTLERLFLLRMFCDFGVHMFSVINAQKAVAKEPGFCPSHFCRFFPLHLPLANGLVQHQV